MTKSSTPPETLGRLTKPARCSSFRATVTLTVFHARITGATAAAAVTFQVFNSSGVAVGSGASATCVIPAGSSSTTNNNASITLTEGLYAVKATSASGNTPDKPGSWALGN